MKLTLQVHYVSIQTTQNLIKELLLIYFIRKMYTVR
jgi:hypothetical protein